MSNRQKKVGTFSYLPILHFKVEATKKMNIGASTEIKLIGQPILSQLLNLLDKWSFKKLGKAQKSDYYYKSFKTWPYFVTMTFGIFSRCDYTAKTCEGLRKLSGKLNHLDQGKSTAKSSAGVGFRN